MRLLKVGAAMVAMVGATPAFAANCAALSFSPTTISFNGTWDPINPAQKTATFTATFNPVPSSTKTIRLIFLDNDSGSPIRLGSAGPQYHVTLSSADYAFKSGTLVSTMPFVAVNGSTSLTFTVSVPANSGEDFVGGATFTESLKYTIECFNNGGSSVGLDTLQPGIPISLTIPRVISLTSASAATVNFQNFTSTTDTTNIQLRSTSSVNVAIDTLYGTTAVNQMVLSGTSSPYPTNSAIPYSMTLNGTAVFKASSLVNQTRGGQIGTTYPLILTLPALPTGKIAGNYSDTITLTLTPGN
jgi:hypothetical protein